MDNPFYLWNFHKQAECYVDDKRLKSKALHSRLVLSRHYSDLCHLAPLSSRSRLRVQLPEQVCPVLGHKFLFRSWQEGERCGPLEEVVTESQNFPLLSYMAPVSTNVQIDDGDSVSARVREKERVSYFVLYEKNKINKETFLATEFNNSAWFRKFTM